MLITFLVKSCPWTQLAFGGKLCLVTSTLLHPSPGFFPGDHRTSTAVLAPRPTPSDGRLPTRWSLTFLYPEEPKAGDRAQSLGSVAPVSHLTASLCHPAPVLPPITFFFSKPPIAPRWEVSKRRAETAPLPPARALPRAPGPTWPRVCAGGPLGCLSESRGICGFLPWALPLNPLKKSLRPVFRALSYLWAVADRLNVKTNADIQAFL